MSEQEEAKVTIIEPDRAYYIEDIRSFHLRYEILDDPSNYMERHAAFRQVALLEELHELGDAFAKGDLAAYLDALVDLDYFNLGTVLLLGQLNVMFTGVDEMTHYISHLRKDHFRCHQLADPQPPRPAQYVFFLGNVYQRLGEAFHAIAQAKRVVDPTQHFQRAAISLRDVHRTVVDHAFMCGLDFTEAWTRVHNANMQKVRAATPNDSKRGSKYDVIKPPGWVAPDLSDLVGEDEITRPLVLREAAA